MVVGAQLEELDAFVALENLRFALTLKKLERLDKDVCVEAMKRLVNCVGALSQLKKCAHGAVGHSRGLNPTINEVSPGFRRPPVDVGFS